MDLLGFNPWWKTGKVSLEFLGRNRKIFDEVVTYADKRQIVLFTEGGDTCGDRLST